MSEKFFTEYMYLLFI